jgi:hypothetical protein
MTFSNEMLTLTVPELGYNKKPVRITAMREDANGTIQIDAEDFPWGTATPTLYPHQPGAGYITQANADPASSNCSDLISRFVWLPHVPIHSS